MTVADIARFGSVVLKSVEGSPIAITVEDGGVTLDRSSKVIQADIVGRNGVIHGIDIVILPPDLSEANRKEVVLTFCKALPNFAASVTADANFGNWERAEVTNSGDSSAWTA